MEVMANSAFDAFRDMYYMGGYSSVYFWDLDEGFASCWLIKKASDPTIKSGTKQIPHYTVRYGTASQPAPAAVSVPYTNKGGIIGVYVERKYVNF